MIKLDMVKAVSAGAEISQARAELAVDHILTTLKAAFVQGQRVELRGLGVFLVKRRKSGIGRNPRTGEIIPIPPGRAVRFKPGKALRKL